MSVKIKTWTYTRNFSDAKDAVRLLVGDTDPEDKQLDDDEIYYLLSTEGGPLNAAIMAAVGLAAFYSRRFDEYSTDQSQGRTGSKNSIDIAKSYGALVTKLLAQRGRKGVVGYAGGISGADKMATESNTDNVRPFFRRDMMDYRKLGDVVPNDWEWLSP